MKCIMCDQDVNRQDRYARGTQPGCPHCDHPFVTEPADDHFTDKQILNAVKRVSQDDALYYLRAHIHYEIERIVTRKRRQRRIWSSVFLVASAAGLIIMIVSDLTVGSVVSFVVMAVSLYLLTTRLKYARTVDQLLDQWFEVNPDHKLIVPGGGQKAAPATEEANLGSVSFDHVLICDRNEYVDFFLANLFHFHFSCPVLGYANYPDDVFADMLARLKQNPRLKVLVVHDFTPYGLQLLKQVRDDSKWFGDMDVEIVDIGLGPRHRSLMRNQLKNLDEISGKRTGTEPKEIWAELTVLRPRFLLTSCANSLQSAEPIPERTGQPAASNYVYFGTG